ncbi:four and a half LIM domains protein limpet isoform X1 [Haematobia irritans]|uniref:four and a half LIM domains protein limpet isoform X1 n=1 Tax=Haematobia irritans TaxID=7368 RepID=UPI003F4F873F
MGDLLSEFGDLVFTLVIGYIGAVEFLYVVRHLYHWSCNHDGPDSGEEHDTDSLARLQENMRQQLANATATEQAAGKKVMRDGVMYEDGFRVDPNQGDIDKLKDQLANKSAKDVKRQELEKELDNQKQIADKIRKELQEKEAEVAERQRKEIEENERRIREAELKREREQREREEAAAKKQREEEERRRQAEAEENARKLKEAQVESERKQREAEEQAEREENERRMLEAERQMEEQQRLAEEMEREGEEQAEREENERRMLEAERQMEEQQHLDEEMEEENERKMLEIEQKLEEHMRLSEASDELTDNERQLIASIKERGGFAEQRDEASDQKEAELLQRILAAREQLGEESEEEQSQKLFDFERDKEKKQRRIEENARLFLEAEREMADLQEQMMEAVQKREFESGLESVPQTPVVEELCVKKMIHPLEDETLSGPVSHRVKTQMAQNRDDSYSRSSKSLLFPGISDDASSNEPISSQQSSFSNQPSDEITTGNESQYPQVERQEPEGEDTNVSQNYSDDYLRSLDGIKGRPLSREDRSGRRIAFKKRRSSGSSNSSRDSRASRDEELKMFTSLEEEEMQAAGQSEFTPLRYSSEPTLKVKGHHRRHKRSPAKDMRSGDESPLERLGEENVDPWGEVVREPYKHTEFWKREKAMSIEEERELEKPLSSEETAYDTATNLPSASSFEEATQIQNEKALSNLRKKDNRDDGADDTKNQATKEEETSRSDTNENLQTSSTTRKEASPSSSTSLRRSPRVEEIDQYEERWNESNTGAPSSAGNTPMITVDKSQDFGPWRDQYGLMMEGLSDFYDFTASVNPSRSRSTSRNPSPSSTAPNTPQPKNVSFEMSKTGAESGQSVMDVYDDTNALDANELSRENIGNFLDSIQEQQLRSVNSEDTSEVSVNSLNTHLQYVTDDHPEENGPQIAIPLLNVIADSDDNNVEMQESNGDDMNSLVANLRSQRIGSSSRSRSKSPLPTPQNIQKSLDSRRYKMIKHNEDVLEKLIETNLLPESTEPTDDTLESSTVDRSRSRSRLSSNSSDETDSRRSRSKSPLPTAENIQRSLETRRHKKIQENDEILEKLIDSNLLPESVDIEILEPSPSANQDNDDCSKEAMSLLVENLRRERSRSRSRSRCRSPLPTADACDDHFDNEGLIEKFSQQMQNSEPPPVFTAPLVSIEITEPDSSRENDDEYSRENMDSLVQSLRVNRSRSRSKSPMRLPTAENLSKSLEARRSKRIELNDEIQQQLEERARTPEPPPLTVEYVYEFVEAPDENRERMSRSRTPSRSPSLAKKPSEATEGNPFSRNPSRATSPSQDSNFHVMLNLEGSQNRTLSKKSEERESSLADRQKQLDEEALDKLRNASEEVELRTLSPPNTLSVEETKYQEENDLLTDLPKVEQRKMMRCSPTTPDYDRTISQEMKDVERIKQEMLESGFKRSTYVGESMDFVGREYEPLRREAARFQRSKSPSPSFSETPNDPSQLTAAERRHIQDLVLAELTESSEARSTGAIRKTPSGEVSISTESTDGTSIDPTSEYEEMRRRNAEFRRSASKSRSPLGDTELAELKAIDEESARREYQDMVLDQVSYNCENFQEFSRHLNTNFMDRRASDSVLISKSEDKEYDETDIEPEEYHHFRRFSLAQEQPEEQYPDDDYIFIEQVEVRSRSGSKTWFTEEVYRGNTNEFWEDEGNQHSPEAGELNEDEEGEVTSADAEDEEDLLSLSKDLSPDANAEDLGEIEDNSSQVDDDNEPFELDDDYDDEESNGSEDDRRTVIEVDDEIDEDISDFNERGPAEESHHEQSECEEAEREMDRYAGREASDWAQVEGDETASTEEADGAVGAASSSPYDSDSFAIDQIYDDAIRNRKQSGILREFDTILSELGKFSRENSIKDIDDQYALWSKTHKKPKIIDFNSNFLESERRDTEMRYLGDAVSSARQSTRLRSRYGYSPVLQSSTMPDDIEVDLSYKPKREYNWRKNFRLSDDDITESKENSVPEQTNMSDNPPENMPREENIDWELNDDREEATTFESRKFSLGGESVTLFSQIQENAQEIEESGAVYAPLEEIKEEETLPSSISEEQTEIPKKKKTKKKSRKDSRGSVEVLTRDEDNDDYERPVYSRRSSSIQMETDSPKRKSRSRRSSRTSLTNEEPLGKFSPQSNVAYADPICDLMEEYTEVKETTRPKKIKKRKKTKEVRDVMADVVESPREEMFNGAEIELPPEATVSATITPESASVNLLSTLSPQESICVTPGSEESELGINSNQTTTDASNSNHNSNARSSTFSLSFDILKDANFYPLF